ncbi:flagellar biosynthetic protein FliO [Mangrovibrevibacter kandeliae]|uniref:flagellar biosynthetic protein FliO n=1 Tax=Mangrovibrevibacter kandeliae TaxID=2968473 RepID=UPI002117D554|nr:flagellar biosynthetic protein FliO [Aurantimonas sp. CSK15Z-1]MCQ8782779.1 flagellar biosynthetic protein FliO [Aurantimonas sp. CSK15Z-1]
MRDWLAATLGEGFASIAWVLLVALFVIALAVVLIWLARRTMGGALGVGPKSRAPRLAIVDATAIDPKRKLVLVRRDEVEHLVLIGGQNDILIEANIARVPAARGRTEPQIRREPETAAPGRPAGPPRPQPPQQPRQPVQAAAPQTAPAVAPAVAPAPRPAARALPPVPPVEPPRELAEAAETPQSAAPAPAEPPREERDVSVPWADRLASLPEIETPEPAAEPAAGSREQRPQEVVREAPAAAVRRPPDKEKALPAAPTARPTPPRSVATPTLPPAGEAGIRAQPAAQAASSPRPSPAQPDAPAPVSPPIQPPQPRPPQRPATGETPLPSLSSFLARGTGGQQEVRRPAPPAPAEPPAPGEATPVSGETGSALPPAPEVQPPVVRSFASAIQARQSINGAPIRSIRDAAAPAKPSAESLADENDGLDELLAAELDKAPLVVSHPAAGAEVRAPEPRERPRQLSLEEEMERLLGDFSLDEDDRRP